MPYIDQESRELISPMLDEILEAIEMLELSVGEINFIITKIIHKWIETDGLRYVNLNAAIGVLDCAKMELYRCVAAPYEELKIKENGCISNLDGNPDEYQKDWKKI